MDVGLSHFLVTCAIAHLVNVFPVPLELRAKVILELNGIKWKKLREFKCSLIFFFRVLLLSKPGSSGFSTGHHSLLPISVFSIQRF